MRTILISLLLGAGMLIAGCEQSRMVRENDTMGNDEMTANEAMGAQGDMGSLGQQERAGSGMASEDAK